MPSNALEIAKNRASSCISRWKHRDDDVGKAVKLGLISKEIGPECDVGNLLRTSTVGVVHGRGVIAKRKIPANKCVIMFTGSIEEHSTHTNCRYCYSMEKCGFQELDLKMVPECGANIGMFVNTAYRTNKQANCEVLWRGCVLFLYTTRVINAGDELLLDYHVRV